MGLFSLKKKEQKPENLPPLKFPELPSISHADIPTYDPGIIREATAIRKAVIPREEARPEPMMKPMMRPMPAMPSHPMAMPESREQPLFIKVDTYKEVVDTLSLIKVKLADAGHILEELTKLKEEEDKELSAWHSDISAIKEKLMLVGQKLSE